MSPTVLRTRVGDAVLDDLRRRLRATRWPDEIAAADPWMYGFSAAELRRICTYWAETFDWRAAEEAMFEWPHFEAAIGAHRIHYVHVRRAQRDSLPLILTHGWPGSFLEMLRLIPLLPEYDLVIPSLPGYGFSGHPAAPGCNTFAIADLWAELMARLGYERFGAQGGDIGASVSTILGWKHAERVAGVHLNYIPASYRPDLAAGAKLAPEEEAFLAEKARWAEEHGAYSHLQRTQPQTLAYGLNDSPAALAAWILERFRNWGDCDGRLESRFSLDDLLANVTLYWATGTIGSSCRLYLESSRAPLAMGAGERVGVPCAVARFPKEAPFPPRAWVERGYRVARWTEMPAGGHFAAWEEPERLAADVRAFFQ